MKTKFKKLTIGESIKAIYDERREAMKGDVQFLKYELDRLNPGEVLQIARTDWNMASNPIYYAKTVMGPEHLYRSRVTNRHFFIEFLGKVKLY